MRFVDIPGVVRCGILFMIFMKLPGIIKRSLTDRFAAVMEFRQIDHSVISPVIDTQRASQDRTACKYCTQQNQVTRLRSEKPGPRLRCWRQRHVNSIAPHPRKQRRFSGSDGD